MPYRGKPSKGCYACRQRKIRCDQRTEGCTQCAKVNRQCPGYRNQLDLMFENESDKVRNRASVRAKGRVSPRSGTNSPPSAGDNATSSTIARVAASGRGAATLAGSATQATQRQGLCTQPATPPWGPIPALSPPIEDRASAYFFSNYCNYIQFVNTSTKPHVGGCAADLWTCELDGHLLASMKAVGLSGLSNSTNNPGLIHEAWKHYLQAIRLTNSALQSPATMKKDSTLLAIITLATFETINGDTRNSLTAWKNHVDGAAALIKLRGVEQLTTSIGRRMFTQVTTSLIVVCTEQDIALPEAISELMKEATERGFVDVKNPMWRLREVYIEFAKFQARIKEGYYMTNRPRILEIALDLDTRMLQIVADLPEDFAYQTVYTDADPDIVYCGYYHVYKDYWMSQVWNSVRTFRMLLNMVIRQVLLKGFSSTPPWFVGREYTAQFQVSTETLYQLQSDVIASVPQHVGYLTKKRTGRLPEHFLWADFNNDLSNPMVHELAWIHLPIIRSAGSNLLLWALSLCGHLDVCTESTRAWLINMLRYTRRVMGIQQAALLADRMEENFKRKDVSPQAPLEQPIVVEQVEQVA